MISLERKVLSSLLKMTKDGEAGIEEISLDAGLPVRVVSDIIKKSSMMDVIKLEGNTFMMDVDYRVKAAIRAIDLGADLEHVCKLLKWNEFEDVSIQAFQNNHFSIKKHFRFRHLSRWREIDILALKEPIAVSVDCKHWRRGWRRSSIIGVVEDQINRTCALTDESSMLREKMGIAKWKEAVFIPLILSLIPSELKFYKDVPIVPVLQLRDFLAEMAAYTSSLTHFSKRFST